MDLDWVYAMNSAIPTRAAFQPPLRKGQPKMGRLASSTSVTIAGLPSHSGRHRLLIDPQRGPLAMREPLHAEMAARAARPPRSLPYPAPARSFLGQDDPRTAIALCDQYEFPRICPSPELARAIQQRLALAGKKARPRGTLLPTCPAARRSPPG